MDYLKDIMSNFLGKFCRKNTTVLGAVVVHAVLYGEYVSEERLRCSSLEEYLYSLNLGDQERKRLNNSYENAVKEFAEKEEELEELSKPENNAKLKAMYEAYKGEIDENNATIDAINICRKVDLMRQEESDIEFEKLKNRFCDFVDKIPCATSDGKDRINEAKKAIRRCENSHLADLKPEAQHEIRLEYEDWVNDKLNRLEKSLNSEKESRDRSKDDLDKFNARRECAEAIYPIVKEYSNIRLTKESLVAPEPK